MEEAHPIQVRPDLPLEERVTLLEEKLAQAWDQLWWWTHLSQAERDNFTREHSGHQAPIRRFYEAG